MTVGFMGLGIMGLPMASNMARAGTDLVVWNRSRAACEALRQLGAEVADAPADVFALAQVVFLMLADGEAMDAVLRRGTARFDKLVTGHTIVHMGTTEASYSRGLAVDTTRAGGRYVELPVSGSRRPAEAGQLIGMAAGDADAIAEVVPLLAPVCASVVPCGEVPQAMQMKLAVNLFLITQVVGLAEAFHFAQCHDLDLQRFQEILDSGPMASAVSRTKLDKLVQGDFDAQASVRNVFYNSRLIADAARDADVSSPLIDDSRALFAEADLLGHGQEDMAAVVRALETRTAARRLYLGRSGT